MSSFEIVTSYGIWLQDYAVSGTACVGCCREIQNSEVAARATCTAGAYHLDCFPAMPFLRAETEVVNRVFDRGNKERAALWVLRHDAGLEFHRLRAIESAYGRRVTTQLLDPSHIVRVLEWLPAADVCMSAGTNREWYTASWSAALWLSRRSQFVSPASFTLHPKLQFALNVKSSCSWCNRAPTLTEVVIFCPVTHRPVCRECRGSGDFLVTVAELKRRFRMTLDFLKGLKLVTFEYAGDTFAYFPLVVDAVVSHRVRKSDKLIQKVRECLPPFVLDACRSLKYSVSSGFPLLSTNEKSKMAKYVLALNFEDGCQLREVTQQLRSHYVPNINTDN